MAILTANQDYLRADEKKMEELEERTDPLGKEASNRIKIYDKQLGFAIHPEEKAPILKYKGAVDAKANSIIAQRNKYSSQYSAAMAAADKKAAAAIKAASNQAKVNVKSQPIAYARVIKNGKVELTYAVNADWLKQNAAALKGKKVSKNTYDIPAPTYNTGNPYTRWSKGNDKGYGSSSANEAIAKRKGTDPYSILKSAQDETKKLNDKIKAATKTAAKQAAAINAKNVAAVKKTVASEKAIAVAKHNQSISQYNKAAKATRSQWDTYLSGQQKKFKQGIADNTKSIAQLVNSGALNMKAAKRT